MGVFKSLDNKPEGSKFYGIYEKILKMSGVRSNGDVLRKIFEGILHKTSTHAYFRGKGLNAIYKAYKKDDFSDFVMITNDVIYDSRADTYEKLSVPFSGTFVYWTLRQGNRSFPNED